MTIHVPCQHECPECAAHYLPYDIDVPCPRCGTLEVERIDFIPMAVESVRFNLTHYGSYTPRAWWVGTLGDHVLRLVFDVLKRYHDDGAGQEFAAFASSSFAENEWPGQEYLKGHVLDIAVRVFDSLDAEDHQRAGDGGRG